MLKFLGLLERPTLDMLSRFARENEKSLHMGMEKVLLKDCEVVSLPLPAISRQIETSQAKGLRCVFDASECRKKVEAIERPRGRFVPSCTDRRWLPWTRGLLEFIAEKPRSWVELRAWRKEQSPKIENYMLLNLVAWLDSQYEIVSARVSGKTVWSAKGRYDGSKKASGDASCSGDTGDSSAASCTPHHSDIRP